MPTLWASLTGSLTNYLHCVGWPPVPALYNAPVFAASAAKVMAAQSVSIDKYPKGEQQVGEMKQFGLRPRSQYNLLHLAELHFFTRLPKIIFKYNTEKGHCNNT